MIKRIVLLLVFASSFFFWGCINSIEKQPKNNLNEKTGIDTIKMFVDYINNNDNSTMSEMFFDMVSCKFENAEITYIFKPNEDYIKVKNIRKHRESEKRSVMNRLELEKSTNESFADFLKILVNNDIRIKFIYKDKTDSDTCHIVLSTDDIRQVLCAEGQPTIEHLKSDIKSIQIQLPIQLDELTIWHDYSIIGNNVTFLYEIDETITSMDYLMENYDLVKAHLSEQLLGVDNGPNDNFMHQVKALGLGMKYVYFGSITNKRMEIVFKNEELI